MQTIEKQALPVVKDKDNNSVAVIYFSQDRERIIYTLRKADEEEIIELLKSEKPESK